MIGDRHIDYQIEVSDASLRSVKQFVAGSASYQYSVSDIESDIALGTWDSVHAFREFSQL